MSRKLTFAESFGYGPKNNEYNINFELDFSDEEVEILRNFLRVNGDCNYVYLEHDYPHLFDRINDAANEAVLEALNKHRRKIIDFYDVDWLNMRFDFYWPDELLR